MFMTRKNSALYYKISTILLFLNDNQWGAITTRGRYWSQKLSWIVLDTEEKIWFRTKRSSFLSGTSAATY